jgi:tetratricopeptide (TPR) repeat protein
MASKPNKLDEALAFLQEGERNNPESLSIQTTLCELFLVRFNRPLEAEPHGRKALELLAVRDPKTLSLDEKEDANSAYRWLVILYRNLGDEQAQKGEAEKARALYGMARLRAQECLQRYPEDPTAIQFLRKYTGK